MKHSPIKEYIIKESNELILEVISTRNLLLITSFFLLFVEILNTMIFMDMLKGINIKRSKYDKDKTKELKNIINDKKYIIKVFIDNNPSIYSVPDENIICYSTRLKEILTDRELDACLIREIYVIDYFQKNKTSLKRAMIMTPIEIINQLLYFKNLLATIKSSEFDMNQVTDIKGFGLGWSKFIGRFIVLSFIYFLIANISSSLTLFYLVNKDKQSKNLSLDVLNTLGYEKEFFSALDKIKDDAYNKYKEKMCKKITPEQCNQQFNIDFDIYNLTVPDYLKKDVNEYNKYSRLGVTLSKHAAAQHSGIYGKVLQFFKKEVIKIKKSFEKSGGNVINGN